MGYWHFRHARRIDADTIGFYHNDMTKLLSLNKATANEINIDSGATNSMVLDGLNVVLKIAGIKMFQFYQYSGDDIVMAKTTNNNIYLKPDGTGVVKFGTHTATGDAVSDGSIEIKDAGGTVRKLMTKA